MTGCPCGSKHNYASCCGVYLESTIKPASPEALMRSRYTAYSLANIPYIKKTMRGKPLSGFDEIEAMHWAKTVIWMELQIVSTALKKENVGYVEFIARFMENKQIKSIHETSEFHREDGAWFYVDGVQQPTSKVAFTRNMPCPCGSQKKFKNCHAKE